MHPSVIHDPIAHSLSLSSPIWPRKDQRKVEYVCESDVAQPSVEIGGFVVGQPGIATMVLSDYHAAAIDRKYLSDRITVEH
jgi:hypothetical protein